jgi:hypothetical protein
MKRVLILTPLVLLGSIAIGVGLMFLGSLPFMQTSLVNEQTEDDWRRLFLYGGLILGGLSGILLVLAMWMNALFGWEPGWDRSAKRRG